MIDIRRDPTGDVARLRCDRCRRLGMVQIFGQPRIPHDPGAFAWVRRAEASGGWVCLESGDADGEVTDVCRRCWRRVLRGDDTTKPKRR